MSALEESGLVALPGALKHVTETVRKDYQVSAEVSATLVKAGYWRTPTRFNLLRVTWMRVDEGPWNVSTRLYGHRVLKNGDRGEPRNTTLYDSEASWLRALIKEEAPQ